MFLRLIALIILAFAILYFVHFTLLIRVMDQSLPLNITSIDTDCISSIRCVTTKTSINNLDATLFISASAGDNELVPPSTTNVIALSPSQLRYIEDSIAAANLKNIIASEDICGSASEHITLYISSSRQTISGTYAICSGNDAKPHTQSASTFSGNPERIHTLLEDQFPQITAIRTPYFTALAKL